MSPHHKLGRIILPLALALVGLPGAAHATGAPAAPAHPPAAAQPAHPAPAHPAPAAHGFKLAPHVDAYVAQHGLAKRVVKVTTPGRDVSRVFVPIVTDAHRADFEDRFSKRNGAVLWAQGTSAEYYAKLITEPTKHYHRFNGTDGWTVTHDKNHAHTNIGQFSRYLALELEPHHIRGLEDHFTATDTQAKWKAANPGQELKVSSQGACMWWIGPAEVAKGRSLWHELGVKRSIAPENLRKKLMHAGNERVSVIGVHVPSVEHFNAMSEADLMGPAPSGGSLEAVKE